MKPKVMERVSAVDRRKEDVNSQRPSKSERAASDGEEDDPTRKRTGGEGGSRGKDERMDDRQGAKMASAEAATTTQPPHFPMVMSEDNEGREPSAIAAEGSRAEDAPDEHRRSEDAGSLEEKIRESQVVDDKKKAEAEESVSVGVTVAHPTPTSVLHNYPTASVAVESSHLRADKEAHGVACGQGWVSPADHAIASCRNAKTPESDSLSLSLSLSPSLTHTLSFSPFFLSPFFLLVSCLFCSPSNLPSFLSDYISA
jgi:hypothetical protein